MESLVGASYEAFVLRFLNVQLWNSVLSMECPPVLEVSDQWKATIGNLIQTRANAVRLCINIHVRVEVTMLPTYMYVNTWRGSGVEVKP